MTLLQVGSAPRLSVGYSHDPVASILERNDVLAVIGFGAQAPCADDPRLLNVALEPMGTAPLEVWHASAPVEHGHRDGVAFAHDGSLLFAAMDVPEDGGDIGAAAQRAYTALRTHTRDLSYPHLLRVWNYLDDITVGDGDEERYKHFCVGRALGLGDDFAIATLPAATAVGRVNPNGRLQVYWLASRAPGIPLENPRQVSAYHYPRQYGPRSPSFARAMLAPGDMPLLLSGTAAIQGHESRHADSSLAQLEVTLDNLESLISVARNPRPDLSPRLGAASTLKVYVREADELALLDAALAERLPDVPRVLLHARVCRRELRLEIDGAHD